jgi:hypothetical protein
LAAKPFKPPQVTAGVPVEEKRTSEKVLGRRNRAAWGGGTVEEEGNALRRSKRNVCGDIMHQLFGVATYEQLQQQLRVDEEMRSKVADTLTRQVYFEKELTLAIGNITEKEDRLERVRSLEEKHNLDRERGVRMSGDRFTLMEDVDWLEDVLEAVVTGAVNTCHAAYLSAKAGLSRVASFEYLNLFSTGGKLTVWYLTRLFQEVPMEVISSSTLLFQLRSPSCEYYLHVGHGPEMSLPS